jgi:hypothetical protein
LFGRYLAFFLQGVETTADEAVAAAREVSVLVTETTGKQRDRTFAYAGHLEKLRVGTEADVGEGETDNSVFRLGC